MATVTGDDMRSGEVERDENNSLISADKVKGTTVYDSSGERIGSIHDVMLEKLSGRVAYAVMSFGGFLGIGERYHPLPWDVLEYDTSLNGYRVGMAGEGFRDAPSYSADEVGRGGWGDPTDRYYDDAVSRGSLTRRPGTGMGTGIGSNAGIGSSLAGASMSGGATGSAGTGSMTDTTMATGTPTDRY